MSPHTDIWVEFGKSIGMLFAVLALFLIVLYLVRKFSGRFGHKGSMALIKVLSVHHLSPKEKLMLVSVQEESILIGVSPAGISSLARFDKLPETATTPAPINPAKGFQNLLKTSLLKGRDAQKRHGGSDSSDSGKGEIS